MTQINDDANQLADDSAVLSTSSVAANTGLRWWPAAVLLLTMVILRGLMVIVESPSMPLRLVSLIGPGVVAILVLVWWLFASRASRNEKIIVFVGYIVVAVAVSQLLHPSMQGIVLALVVLPAATAIFAVGLIATSQRPRVRVPVALLALAVGFGSFLAIQSDGFDARLDGKFAWRWTATSEDQFMEGLSERKSSEKLATSPSPSDFDSVEWKGFRGNDRNSVVKGVKLSPNWTTNPPQVLWKARIGPGWSSFAVAGKRLFTQEQRGDEEAVICMDAESGKIVWEHVYPGRFWEVIGGAGPRGTPTISTQGVFALGAEGSLRRLDASTGELIWKRDLKVDAGREAPTWGFAASPLVIDSMVVVFAGGTGDRGIFAYDIEDGKVVWSVASGVHSYSSAQAATFLGTSGILMLTDNGVQFLNTKDGSTIWQYDWKQEDYRVVQPLVDGESVVVGASLGTGASRFTVKKLGDKWEITEDWKTRGLKPDFNDSVLYDGYIYGFDAGIFCCVDWKTGDRVWKRGRYGNGQVLLLADSGQLLVTSEKGELVLLEATPKSLVELGRFSLFDGKTWNHPVLIGDRLYMRNAEEVAGLQLSVAE